jgi:hypothetical protein
MFESEARSLPLSGGPERCFTLESTGLSNKHYTRLDRLARDRHSSLLQTFANYGREMFVGKARSLQ